MHSKDISALRDWLRQSNWSEIDLISLLTCNDVKVVMAATWCLAYVGTVAANLPLATVLHHDDAAAVDLAENALWSIWLRGAPTDIHRRLCDAIRLTEQDCMDKAVEEMDRIIRSAPTYAEAYNQRAIARFLKSDYRGAIEDYAEAIRHNPVHFGALAGLGHCFAALGRYQDALNTYRRVLDVHPRMEGIRQAIGQIKRMVARPNHSGCIPTSWTQG